MPFLNERHTTHSLDQRKEVCVNLTGSFVCVQKNWINLFLFTVQESLAGVKN